jgi:hypothetical protein
MRKLVLLLMLSCSFVGSLNLNYAGVPIPDCYPCPPPPPDPPLVDGDSGLLPNS